MSIPAYYDTVVSSSCQSFFGRCLERVGQAPARRRRSRSEVAELAPAFQLADVFWGQIQPVLPVLSSKQKPGRPRMDDRAAMTAIWYVLRTGCQWKALPRTLGAASTVHDRFQLWRAAGVFEQLWRVGVLTYDAQHGVEWEWQAMDGAITKAPLGGECTGPNPTDRAKQGTKRSVLTDGHGLPLGLTVAGANCPDMKLVELTVVSMIVPRPRPTEETPQHICLDKGYDAADVRQILQDWGYTLHLRTRGEETTAKQTLPGYRARRWVVERSHSWMNRFRRLLIRWEKNAENYLAMLHVACAYICFKAAGLFG